MTALIEQILKVHQMAEALDDSFVDGAVASHSISVKQTPAELVVEANRAGLVHLATSLLKLAAAPHCGAHYHLDETGMADLADTPVVFRYTPASWDNDDRPGSDEH